MCVCVCVFQEMALFYVIVTKKKNFSVKKNCFVCDLIACCFYFIYSVLLILNINRF